MSKFYRGLLLALREFVDSFNVYDFTEKFRFAIDQVKTTLPVDVITFDPVFGTSCEVSEMLCEGERDFITSGTEVIKFRISKERAIRELDEFSECAEFRKLAKEIIRQY